MKSNSDDSRPAIWAEGSQKPVFEPRAYAKAALLIGRETVAGILSRCGATARDVGGELSAGRLRIPEERLGRTGRYLPTAETTGRAVLGGAGILRRAAEVAQPNSYADVPREIDEAYRDLFREGQEAAAPIRAAGDQPAAAAPAPSPASEPQEATMSDELASIRTLLNSAPQAEAPAVKPALRLSGTATKQDPAPGADPSLLQRLQDGCREAAARVLGYWMIAFAFPYGAIRAGIAHLNGEDLRKIRKSGD